MKLNVLFLLLSCVLIGAQAQGADDLDEPPRGTPEYYRYHAKLIEEIVGTPKGQGEVYRDLHKDLYGSSEQTYDATSTVIVAGHKTKDGKFFVRKQSGKWLIEDAISGEMILSLAESKNIHPVTVAANSEYIAIGFNNDTVEVYITSTGELVRKMEVIGEKLEAVGFHNHRFIIETAKYRGIYHAKTLVFNLSQDKRNPTELCTVLLESTAMREIFKDVAVDKNDWSPFGEVGGRFKIR